ncbi:MAG TPA: CPBP family intramembrane glutamic endopeptidase [Pantanalinema sp.]
MTPTMNWKPVGWYLAVVFALTWAMNAWVFFQGGLSNPKAFAIGASLQMLFPAMVAVVFRKWVTKEGFKGSGLCLGKKRYYAIAVGLVLGWVILSFGLSALTPWLSLDTGLTKAQAMMTRLAEQAGKPLGLTGPAFLGVAALQGIVLGPILGLPALFGEEYGWRGYLLPRLLPLGSRRALALHGVIWGLWHAPLIAMGYNYPGHPVLGILMMTLFCVLSGAVLAWLYYASGSIFVASYAHGLINQSVSFVLSLLVLSYHTFIGGALGVIGMGLLALGVWVLDRTGRLSAVGTASLG